MPRSVRPSLLRLLVALQVVLLVASLVAPVAALAEEPSADPSPITDALGRAERGADPGTDAGANSGGVGRADRARREPIGSANRRADGRPSPEPTPDAHDCSPPLNPLSSRASSRPRPHTARPRSARPGDYVPTVGRHYGSAGSRASRPHLRQRPLGQFWSHRRPLSQTRPGPITMSSIFPLVCRDVHGDRDGATPVPPQTSFRGREPVGGPSPSSRAHTAAGPVHETTLTLSAPPVAALTSLIVQARLPMQPYTP